MENKRGLSTVVSIMILVLLVITLISIIWVMVNNLVEEELEEAGTCFGIFEELTINNKFTCYNSSSNEVHFSLNIGEIDIDKVLVSVSNNVDGSQVFEISNVLSDITNLRSYSSGKEVKLPGKNSGRTYIVSNFFSEPDSIRVAPVIGTTTCEVSDSLYEINDCSTIV